MPEETKHQHWEYDTTNSSTLIGPADLNMWGQFGWELVGFTSHQLPEGWNYEFRYCYVFKRKVLP